MAEELRSKSVAAKENAERGEDFAMRFRYMQDQIHELVLESRMAKQGRLEHRDFATRAAFEA